MLFLLLERATDGLVLTGIVVLLETGGTAHLIPKLAAQGEAVLERRVIILLISKALWRLFLAAFYNY